MSAPTMQTVMDLIDGRTEVNGRAIVFRDLLKEFIGTLKARAESEAGRGGE